MAAVDTRHAFERLDPGQSGDAPLYRLAKRALLAAIEAGHYPPGRALPNEAAHDIAIALLGGEIDRRRRALFPPADITQIQRLAEPALGAADQ